MYPTPSLQQLQAALQSSLQPQTNTNPNMNGLAQHPMFPPMNQGQLFHNSLPQMNPLLTPRSTPNQDRNNHVANFYSFDNVNLNNANGQGRGHPIANNNNNNNNNYNINVLPQRKPAAPARKRKRDAASKTERQRQHKIIEFRRRMRLKLHFEQLDALSSERKVKREKDTILVNAIACISALKEKLKCKSEGKSEQGSDGNHEGCLKPRPDSRSLAGSGNSDGSSGSPTSTPTPFAVKKEQASTNRTAAPAAQVDREAPVCSLGALGEFRLQHSCDIQGANKTATDTLDLPEDFFSGVDGTRLSYMSLIHPDEVASTCSSLQLLSKERRSVALVNRLRRVDQTYVSVNAIYALRNPSNHADGYRVVFYPV